VLISRSRKDGSGEEDASSWRKSVFLSKAKIVPFSFCRGLQLLRLRGTFSLLF
jgi:hypothetical protein